MNKNVSHLRRVVLVCAFFLVLVNPCYASEHPRYDNIIDHKSIWWPSEKAAAAIDQARKTDSASKNTLLEIMRGDQASRASIIFADATFAEPGYLRDIDTSFVDRFAVGTVIHPFRSGYIRGFVILNGHPKVLDVSDPKYLGQIENTVFHALQKKFSDQQHARCLWSSPIGYTAQPGDNDNTEIAVSYPVVGGSENREIGTVEVAFRFSYPDRTFQGATVDSVGARRD